MPAISAALVTGSLKHHLNPSMGKGGINGERRENKLEPQID